MTPARLAWRGNRIAAGAGSMHPERVGYLPQHARATGLMLGVSVLAACTSAARAQVATEVVRTSTSAAAFIATGGPTRQHAAGSFVL
jgi:hypothetical protein